MKCRPQRVLASLAFTALLACMPCFASASAQDAASAEAAVRRADAAWAAAAGTGNIDAWMAFTTADAILMLPTQPLASGTDAVRHAVAGLLALPRLSLEWHATSVQISPAGDLAHVLGTYAVEHGGPGSASVKNRGRIIELWRKHPDGTWKCIVASWSAEGDNGNTATPPAAAPAIASQAAMPMPVTKYGDAPVNYAQAIRQYFHDHLKDPESIRYQEITRPEQGSLAGVSGSVFMRETRDDGWIVKATIDAKNTRGEYVGLKTYKFLFHGERMVRALAPLPSDEIKD